MHRMGRTIAAKLPHPISEAAKGAAKMAEQQAILAGGCFWCTEAVFNDVIGVTRVESGYIGGHVASPTYKQVCGGDTGHAEAIRLTFDPEIISYDEILDLFFATHDPTQLNRQGNDVGTQYRSALFPLSAEQEEAARRGIERAGADWPEPIVTTIEPAGEWWPAEDYHQDYWSGEGQRNPYCLAIIPPKLKKLRKSFAHRVKSEAASA
jgi:peptide-methionine (S)-S-oxide reductase